MKVAKRGKERPGTLAPLSRTWPLLWPFGRPGEEMDRLFEEPFGGWLAPTRGLFEPLGPPVDVYENKDNVFVTAELPGMKREEIEVYMSEDMLNIAGERKEETEYKGADTYRNERYFGRFHRSIPLPAPVDPKRIAAHYKDGVLTVTCPKTEEAKRKEIDIKVD